MNKFHHWGFSSQHIGWFLDCMLKKMGFIFFLLYLEDEQMDLTENQNGRLAHLN